MTEQPRLDQGATGPKQPYRAAAEYAALADTLPMPDDKRMAPTEKLALEMGEAAQALRTAQNGWLERRGALEDTPHLTMTRREFELLRDVGLGDGGNVTSSLKTKENYGIPLGAQYASVDIVPEDANLPHATKLMMVDEEDFGTIVDEGRLENQGIKPEDIPRINMKEREFKLFRIIGLKGSSTSSRIKNARYLCGIPQDDQYAPQYALINIESDDPNLRPNEPLLVIVNEIDFGTAIDRDVIDKDNRYLNHDSHPASPLTPESGDGYVAVDISKALTESRQGLQTFATDLMKGKTADPLNGRFWVRAGGVANGQKDAYVWENGRPFASAVELTIAFPGQYDSVCAVVGDRQDPGNGKPGMAQIKDPTVVLAIEGENLKQLQEVYRDLYRAPDFALTPTQKSERDELFNRRLVSLTSEATRKNKAREDEENSRRYENAEQPQSRARPIPDSSDLPEHNANR